MLLVCSLMRPSCRASLYRANAKYAPHWEPRMVCFARADLPRVAVAALQAEAFVVRPTLSRYLRPRR